MADVAVDLKGAAAASIPTPVVYTFSSESVSEGHPDKVCDYIADSILDAYISGDAKSRVACEVLCKEGHVILAGEITSKATVDHEAVARKAIREIGYTDPNFVFNADGVEVVQILTRQSGDIALGVNTQTNESKEQGAGDQGIMFGYATDETPELMPLAITLAHRLTRGLADDRKADKYNWLRPDAKSQVAVRYADGTPLEVTDVLVSTQHSAEVERETITAYVREELAPRVLGAWYNDNISFKVNPTGRFVDGGPSADAGVTGRKIIVDTYGGAAKHGGGAFSGKDPSKVDRSAAYFCRYVARELVKAGIVNRAEIQVAYAIGVAQPISVKVDTFGTGDNAAAVDFVRGFDFRPAAIVEKLSLLQPIYRKTTNYGHFGKPELPWEK
jgi:S-adenosylmethionine synthetase